MAPLFLDDYFEVASAILLLSYSAFIGILVGLIAIPGLAEKIRTWRAAGGAEATQEKRI